MFLPHVATIHLFPGERAALLDLLRDIAADDWYLPTVCAGWNVHDLVLHLIGADVNLLSGTRDGFSGSPVVPAPTGLDDWATLVAFIDDRNATWVEAMRRVSPPLAVDLLAVLGERVAAWLPEVNLDAPGPSVDWAGTDPAPLWLHIAREYTERWVHQQQIRDAVGRPGLREPEWLHPVLAAFALGLPHALRGVGSEGSVAELHVSGVAGGIWAVRRDRDRWRLLDTEVADPDATLTLDQDTAWRAFTRGLEPTRVRDLARLAGDVTLTEAMLHMVTIIA